MVEFEQRDLVCLHLLAHTDALERSPATPALTAAGIGDALQLGDAAARRIRLLDDLAEMERDGIVAAEERPVAGHDAPRTVYRLTESGREHATELRRDLGHRSVVVSNGTREEVPLLEIGRYFEDDPTPLVTALARVTDDGEVPLNRHVGEEFVGRTSELATLREAIETSFTRECRVAIVDGTAGMGKTTLVREAIERVHQEREELVVAHGSATAGASDPYEVFRQVFDVVPDGDETASRLEAARASDSPADPATLEARRSALFEDVANDLREAAVERPVVVFLDNLQWADEASLGLFAHLATTIDEFVYPVAFVGAYRTPAVEADDTPLPTVLERIDGGSASRRVSLEPLGRSDTRALLAGILGRQRLPDEFVEFVHGRTGGNPLFVRETATHLLETGQVDPEAETYPSRPGEIELPPQVTAQIDERLSRLDEPSRELLRLGAVVGERIPTDVLAAASDLPSARRREYVDALVAGRLWEPVGGEWAIGSPERSEGLPSSAGDGSNVLQFVSGGVREAVADGIPDQATREYHARVAEAFTTVYDDVDVRAARVAHHYEAAGDERAALEYFRRAGEQARASYAHEVAIERYERALELARGLELEDIVPDLLLAIGAVNRIRSRYDEAERRFEAVRDRTEDERALEATSLLANIRVRRGEYEAALALVGDALDRWDGNQARETICKLLGIKAWILTEHGRLAEAREAAERESAIAENCTDDFLIGKARQDLGKVDLERGDLESALSNFQTAKNYYDRVDRRRHVARVIGNIANVHERGDDLQAAREAYERAKEIHRSVGDRTGVATTTYNLGSVATKCGEFGAAVDQLNRAGELATELELPVIEGLSHATKGVVYLRRGDLAAAERQGRASLEIFDEIDRIRSRSAFRSILAYVVALSGRPSEAEDIAETARNIATESGLGETEANARWVLGSIERKFGDPAGAIAHHENLVEATRDETHELMGNRRAELARSYLAAYRPTDALEAAQTAHDAVSDGPDPWISLRTERTLGACFRANGAFEDASNRLECALETAREIGARVEEGRITLERGRLYRARGDEERARSALERALSIASETGAEVLAEDCRAALEDGPAEN